MKSAILMIVIFAFAAFEFSGCSYLKKRIEKKETIEYSLNGKNKKQLKLDNINGEITIRTSNDTLGILSVKATKILKVKADEMNKPLDGIVIKVDTTGDDIRISCELQRTKTFFGISDNTEGEINYDILVPVNLKVDISQTNGSMTASNLGNRSILRITNGGIILDKCSGNIDAEVTNGSLTGNLDSTRGLNIKVINGSIKLGNLKSVSGDVSASVTNGSVKSEGIEFSNVSQTKKNLNGRIGDGKYRIDLTTVNGSVNLYGSRTTLTKEKIYDKHGIHFDIDDEEEIKTDNSKSNKQDTAKTFVAPQAKDSGKTK